MPAESESERKVLWLLILSVIWALGAGIPGQGWAWPRLPCFHPWLEPVRSLLWRVWATRMSRESRESCRGLPRGGGGMEACGSGPQAGLLVGWELHIPASSREWTGVGQTGSWYSPARAPDWSIAAVPAPESSVCLSDHPCPLLGPRDLPTIQKLRGLCLAWHMPPILCEPCRGHNGVKCYFSRHLCSGEQVPRSWSSPGPGLGTWGSWQQAEPPYLMFPGAPSRSGRRWSG